MQNGNNIAVLIFRLTGLQMFCIIYDRGHEMSITLRRHGHPAQTILDHSAKCSYKAKSAVLFVTALF
jgi:hypothetical protein